MSIIRLASGKWRVFWRRPVRCVVCHGLLEPGEVGPECDDTGCPARDGSDG